MTNITRPPCDEAVIAHAVTYAPSTGAAGCATATSAPAADAITRRWVLVAAILGSSLAFIDSTVVNVALPAIQQELHSTAANVQWVVEGYSLFLAALILVGGSLGDRYGRRLIFALGITLFTVASMACGLAPNITTLIVARCIQGVGGALLTPGSLALLSAAYPAAIRGRAIGLWSGFTSITSTVGPVLGGALVQYASWRWIFYLNVPIAAVTVAILFWRAKESREAGELGPLDWLGATLATLGLGGLVFGLIESSTFGLTAPLVVVSLIVGVGALIAFIVVEMRSPAPMLPLGLFRSPTFSGANLLTLLLYAATGALTFFLPFTLIRAQGYPATAAGAAFLPFVLIMFLLSRWSGGLVDRFGAKLPLVVGPLIAAVGFLLFAIPDIGAGSYWVTYFPAVVVLGVGMAIAVAPLTTAVMGAVSPDRSGIASGVNNAVARMASLLAIAVFGVVIAGVFNSALDAHLTALHVAPAIRQALDAQRAKLIGAQIPSGVSAAQRAQLTRAIADSFVTGYRVVMVTCAALAVASAIAAGVLVEGKPKRDQN